MSDVMDELEIRIEAKAQSANTAIDALCKKIDKLSGALNNLEIGDINKLASGIENLGSSAKNAESLKKVASALDTLSNVSSGNLKSLATSIPTLTNALNGLNSLSFNSAGLESVVETLRAFGYKTSTAGTQNLGKLKTDLVDFINGINSAGAVSFDFSGLENLLSNLSRLGSKSVTQAVANLQPLKQQLMEFMNDLNGMGGLNFDVSGITTLVADISKLGGKSVTNAITNLPLLSSELSSLMTTLSKAPTVSQNVIDMTSALANLAAQGSKVGSASNSIVNGLNRTNTAATKASKSVTSLAAAFGKFYASYFLVIRGFKKVWEGIESSMDYIETSNYFEVSLSQISKQFEQYGYESAEAYGEALENGLSNLNAKLSGYTLGSSGEALFSGDVGLGMDIESMMNFQAKTLAVTNSVGMLGNASVETTKALSMLAGDLSSLTNLDVPSVMDSLSSGLIGQSRSLYKFGIDITNNTLQQYALAEGIDKAVSEMTQSEKMQLRLLAILDQSQVAWGDLGNTVNSVANQYRVFEQQISNLGRTLGNLFLPIVKNVLPYVNGLIIALNNLFTTLGFDLWGDTWLEDLQDGISGGVVDGLEDIEDAADDAIESVNELIKGVRGFDVLNVITSGSSTTGSTLDELEGTIDLTQSITEAVANYETAWNKAFENAENKASEFAEVLTEKFSAFADVVQDILPAIEGIGIALATYKIATEISGIVTSFSALSSPVGIAIAALAAAAGVFGTIAIQLHNLNEAAKENDLSERFGNIALSLNDIEQAAKYIIDNKNLSEVTTILSTLENLQSIEQTISSNISALDKSNWKVSIGMELSEEEKTSYKNAIDSYIKNVQQYVTDQQYAANIGIKLFLFDDGTSEQVQSVVNSFYNAQNEKLKSLGEELNRVTTEAWNDGLLTIDEIEVISNIQNQMADIQNQLSTSEFEARMQILNMDYSGSELTPESYQKLQEERQKLLDQYTSDLNESMVFTLAQVNMAYEAKIGEADTDAVKEKIKKEWDDAIKEIYKARDEKIQEMELNSLSFDYNTLIDAFGNDLDKAFDGTLSKLSIYAKKFAEGAEWATGGVQSLMTSLVTEFKKEAGKAGAENFHTIVDQMISYDDLEEIAENLYKETGEIPEALADALVSEYALSAITGNMDSLYNLMLISADGESAKAVLEKMEELGIEVPSFLADGVIGNTDLVDKSITDMLQDASKSLTSSGILKDAENLGEEVVENIVKGMGGASLSPSLNLKGVSAQLSYARYSVGGFPEDGWFRASKGEYFGQFDDGTSYIANNNQITDGIASGVYKAVLAAMGNMNSTGNSQDIRVYIGDREIEEVAIAGINRKYREGKRPLAMI